MIFTANIKTPANTSQASLLKTTINVTKGLVYKVEFYFPSGSEGKMGVAVFDGLYQVWPSNVGVFFLGSDNTIPFDDLYLKSSAPFELQCYTYNTDDIFDHLVSVRIGLVSNEVYMARFLPSKTYEEFVTLLAQMKAEKEEQEKQQRARITRTPFRFILGKQKKKERT